MLSRTLASRYLVPNRSLETLRTRVAETLHPSSAQGTTLLRAMEENRFWPAGNTLLAGVEPIRPNCAILPQVSEATYSETLMRAARLWKARVGIGFDLDGCEDPVGALQGLSVANSFIDLGHRPQRGNMATISILHPRVDEFISAKVNRSFPYACAMEDIEGHRSSKSFRTFDSLVHYSGHLRGTSRGPGRTQAPFKEEDVFRSQKTSTLYNFNTSVVVRERDITEKPEQVERVLRMVAEAAWSGGDPGVIFMDRITSALPYRYESVSAELGEIGTLVPCGEQAMHPNEVCTLGSINLASPSFWDRDEFVVQLFRETVDTAVRALDAAHSQMDLLGDRDLERTAERTRRLGLGMMGWADALHGAPRRKERSRELVSIIGKAFKESALSASRDIAEKQNRWCNFAGAEERAHLTLTCAAPTGGISLLAGNRGFSLDPLPEELDGTSPEEQLDDIERWQPHFDNAISKTVSLKKQATVEDMHRTILHALGRSTKTITLYRSGSRPGQPLSTSPEGIRCVGC